MPRNDDGRRNAFAEYASNFTDGYDRTVWQLPEGFKSYRVKAAGVRRLEILGYYVGQNNPKAAPGMLHPERTFSIHKHIGVDDNSYVCLWDSLKQRCPVCDWRAGAKRDPDADAQLVKALEPSVRTLWNVYDYGEPQNNWQLWEFSWHCFTKQLLSRCRDSDPEDRYADFYYPDNGFTLRVGFEEKPLPRGSFFTATTIDFKARATPFTDQHCRALPCLDDLLIITPYDKLRELFMSGIEPGAGYSAPQQNMGQGGPQGAPPPPQGGRGPQQGAPPPQRHTTAASPPPQGGRGPTPQQGQAPAQHYPPPSANVDDWDNQGQAPAAQGTYGQPPAQGTYPPPQQQRQQGPPPPQQGYGPPAQQGPPAPQQGQGPRRAAPPPDDWDAPAAQQPQGYGPPPQQHQPPPQQYQQGPPQGYPQQGPPAQQGYAPPAADDWDAPQGGPPQGQPGGPAPRGAGAPPAPPADDDWDNWQA